MTVELQGFGTDVRKVQLLVGQAASINFQLSPSSVQETVTVTSEAPLIEVTQSKLGGNIDPRQMQELPVNGRNWMDLATLAPGSRANESADTGPVAGTEPARLPDQHRRPAGHEQPRADDQPAARQP